jgi:hypothetical protein
MHIWIIKEKKVSSIHRDACIHTYIYASTYRAAVENTETKQKKMDYSISNLK